MPEPSLRQFQQWMKSRILPGASADASMNDALFNPQRGTPGVERLSVYAGGYVTRIREALAEVYEAVHHVVGEGVFTELAHDYAARHPSHDYNLSFSGRFLPEYLTTWPRTQQLPFLPDLARLEWRICEAFHAFEQRPLDPAQFTSWSLDAWNSARLIFQSSAGVVESAWPIRDIWEARTQPREAISIELVNRPQQVLVFRQQLQVRCELLDAPQARALDALLHGATLGTMCHELAQQSDQSLPVTEWFTRWMREGLIVQIVPVTSETADHQRHDHHVA